MLALACALAFGAGVGVGRWVWPRRVVEQALEPPLVCLDMPALDPQPPRLPDGTIGVAVPRFHVRICGPGAPRFAYAGNNGATARNVYTDTVLAPGETIELWDGADARGSR